MLFRRAYDRGSQILTVRNIEKYGIEWVSGPDNYVEAFWYWFCAVVTGWFVARP